MNTNGQEGQLVYGPDRTTQHDAPRPAGFGRATVPPMLDGTPSAATALPSIVEPPVPQPHR
ncbi:hypothetical protein ACQP1P_28520 [Dactylosporangium sp. CA-052675]|uniref:hypothetical protein n=1 Tax=Dactylosporangium sp. CA-052675 TaxID=3239927 RepID=UPI003D911F62